MNIRKIIKEKTLRLIGLILITIPLMMCYPILLYIGLSVKIATIVMVCLSIIAYILLVTRIEPLLGRMLPFLSPITQKNFLQQNRNTETDFEHLELAKDSVFICRDVSLNDTLAVNLTLQCRLKTI